MNKRICPEILLAILAFLSAMLCATATGKIFLDTDDSGPEIHQDYVPDEIIVKFKNAAARTLEEEIMTGSDVAQLELSSSLDELTRKFRLRNVKPVFKNFKVHRGRLKALLKKDKALLTQREKRILQRLKRAGEKTPVPTLDRIYKLELALEPGQSIQEVVAAYRSDPNIEYAELNYILSICESPNDPLYPLQWPLNNTGQDYPESGYYNPPPGTPDCDIDAPEAWDIHTGSSKVIVAVADSGVDYKHRDLQGNIWVNQAELNGVADVDDDNNGYIDDIYGYDFINNDSDPIDDCGHGTHCSGIIAAGGNNGLDIAGVCWNAKIMALKFLDAAGEGYTSDAAVAFYYAVENGADIISNSWGGDDYSETLKEAIDYAHSQGVIMVAAAGNDYSDSPHYPAYYERVIAVAATNSNDEKATFSNYGNWVDIAAPGVDILSLRADGTFIGTVYDSYTTVESGTSMACPHVAGACALLLSLNPALTTDEVYEILTNTADPISPGICVSGRLNLYDAMRAITGLVRLDGDVYACSAIMHIVVRDLDLRGNGTQDIIVTTSGGDSETVTLIETDSSLGAFTGAIQTNSGTPDIEDGTLQISHGESITATYYNAKDWTDNPAIETDNAVADCKGPAIFNLQVEARSIEARITFETDEPSTGLIRCGLTCGGPYTIVSEDPVLATVHSIQLTDLSSETAYYFIIDANDSVGNQTTDDNGGECYVFTTEPLVVLRVPGEFLTIQAAIDAARDWGGDTVLVADGTHTGSGNRDIDFKGKAITVRSENGPENCIIDCQGTETEMHRGFYFHSGEGQSSILDGFTITNGCAKGWRVEGRGGGIYCTASSPTVLNCIFIVNSAKNGAGMYNDGRYGPSSPTLINCTFSRNSAIGDGGGICNFWYNSSTLTGCTFSENSAGGRGGGMMNTSMSNPTLTDCTFRANSAEDAGGGMYNSNSSPTLTNCTFSGNCGYTGGGIHNRLSSPVVSNCTFSSNMASSNEGGGMYNGESSPMVMNCTFRGNWAENGGGGIMNRDSSPTVTDCGFTDNSASVGGGMFNYLDSSPTVINCTFTGNSADWSGGGVLNSKSNTTLISCRFTGNFSQHGGGMSNSLSTPTLTNCTFSGNKADSGGGMYNYELNRPTLINCTFAANWAPNGNALAFDSYRQMYPSNLQIKNCIFWDGGNEIWNNDNSAMTITYSDVQGDWSGEGNIEADPCFVQPGYWADANDPNISVEPNEPNAVWVEGDYHLLKNSPCIDAGDPNYTAEPNETDLDGKPRLLDGNNDDIPVIDMGAYEYKPPIPAEVRIVPRTVNLASKGKWIIALLWLPEDHNVSDIDPNSVLLEDEIEAESLRVDEQQQVAIARFSRSELQAILNPLMADQVELTITGQLTDGTVFKAIDTIRVRDKASKK